ncbi:MAG: AAA family ATPase [Kofleriaceae bacterium]
MDRTLAFGPNRLLVASPEALHVVALDTEKPVTHAFEVRAFAVVGEAIWTIGKDGVLAVDQRPTSIRLKGDGRFVTGARDQVVWLGEAPCVLTRTRDGVAAQGLGAVDHAIAIGLQRVIVARGNAIEMREAGAVKWTAKIAGTVREAAIVFEGRAIAVYAEAGQRGQITVFAARDGVVLHRANLDGATAVRFAAKRGIAIVVLAKTRIAAIDLRFGRILADRDDARPIAEIAIDESGQELALRHDDVFGPVSTIAFDALARVTPDQPVAPVVESVPEPAREPVVEEVAAAPIDLCCPALPPHEPIAPIEDLRDVLATQREHVLALAQFAIACAWDEGRLAFTTHDALPNRTEVIGLGGTVRGRASAELVQASDRADRALLAARALRSPLDALGLTPLERDILLVIAAPSLWGELARMYGILTADPARPLCDEHAVAELLARTADHAQIAACLDPEAPLVQRGLVRIGESRMLRPFLPLTVDRVVLRLMRGVAPLAEEDVELRVGQIAFEDLRLVDKAKIADAIARAPSPLRLAIHGRTGTGRHSLAAAIAGTRGIACVAAPTKELIQRLALTGHIPCVSTAADVTGPVIYCLGATDPTPANAIRIDLATLSITERAACWRGVGVGDAVAAELAARYAIGPGTIARVSGEADLDAAVRRHLAHGLGAIATRIDRLPAWSSVILPDDIQDSIAELIGRIRHRATVFERWGFDRVMTTSRGTVALFQGGPGTGKTLVAGAIANELGLELYRVDVSRIMSKWIGETEQNLGTLFDAAEQGNAIILFDEADSLFAKRTEVRNASDRYANLEVNYLLQRLDSFEGIAILTTNFGTAIDTAFKRRLSFRLTFPFPDEAQRERLWRAHLPATTPIRGPIDLAMLAKRYQLSGGYIRNCALRAAFLAAEQGGTLTALHLERAIEAEYREIGKLANSGVLE